jgi:hypothetical protein
MPLMLFLIINDGQLHFMNPTTAFSSYFSPEKEGREKISPECPPLNCH